MKTCSKCNQEKSPSDFYKNKNAKDGLAWWCKLCASQSVRKWYESGGRERTRELARARVARLRQIPEGVAELKAKWRTDRTRHPGRRAARKAVAAAVADGRLPAASSLPCEAGGHCVGLVEYHHDSYKDEDRLRVRPLCKRHHALWHKDHKVIPHESEVG